jgi:hypothetical protein
MTEPFDKYVLGGPDGRTPVGEPDVIKWGRWFETADRCVASTFLPHGAGRISTIFLGIDHQFGDGPPILYETMSFMGDEHEDFFDRYATWDEAEAGHRRIVLAALKQIGRANAMLDQAVGQPVVRGDT